MKNNIWLASTVIAIIGAASAPNPGSVVTVAGMIIKGGKGFDTRHGKIFKVRNWSYNGAVNQ